MSHTPTTNQRKFLKKLSNDGSAGYKKNNDNNNKKKKEVKVRKKTILIPI